MSDDRPKHKPQKKHTLEEVLKSLQDLIRNDLVAAQTAASQPIPPALQAPPATDSFDAALDTLDHLIDHELVEPVKQVRTAVPPLDDELPDDRDWPDDDAVISQSLAAEAALEGNGGGEAVAPPDWTAPAPPEAPRGAQDEFPFDAPPPAGAAASGTHEPSAPAAGDASAAEPAHALDVPSPKPAAEPAADDDIPVLHEVAHEILSAPGTLPTPEQARDIAVHVVARLNIELRKGGAQPLDPSTIDRLQKLLREALASKSPGNS
jgi:hypothetical protein